MHISLEIQVYIQIIETTCTLQHRVSLFNLSHVKGLCKVITEMPELDVYDCYT